MLSDTVEATWRVAGGRVFAGVSQRRPSALGPSKDALALAFLALVWGCLDSPSTLETLQGGPSFLASPTPSGDAPRREPRVWTASWSPRPGPRQRPYPRCSSWELSGLGVGR